MDFALVNMYQNMNQRQLLLTTAFMVMACLASVQAYAASMIAGAEKVMLKAIGKALLGP